MAVKQAVFEPIGMADADDYAAREAWREIVLLAMLDHPNIIKIHSAYVPDLQKEEAAITGVPLEDRPKDVWPLAGCHILMPLMETNLRRCIAEEPAMLSDDTRLTLATELASALEYLHSHDVIHRDIKSLNVLLQKTVTKTGGKNGSMRKRTRWTVKLADFGSARALPAAMTDNPFRSDLTGGIGTCAWMAPELFGSKQYDCSADTYSFGIVLWELFTGKVPFDKATNFQIPNLVMQGTRPDLPEEGKEPHFSGPRADTIRSLITQCWHKHSQKRPEMYTVVQTLESIPLSRGGATREELTLEIFQKPGTPRGGGRRGSEQRPQPLDMSELSPSTESGTNGTPRKSEGKSKRNSKDMSKELMEAAAETKDKRDSGKKDRKRNSEKQKREAKESESTSSSPSGSVLLNGKTPSEALNPKTTLEDGRGELSDSGGSVVSTKSDPPQKPKPKEEKKSKRKSARRSERDDSSGRESVDRDEKKREKKKGKDRKSKN